MEQKGGRAELSDARSSRCVRLAETRRATWWVNAIYAIIHNLLLNYTWATEKPTQQEHNIVFLARYIFASVRKGGMA